MLSLLVCQNLETHLQSAVSKVSAVSNVKPSHIEIKISAEFRNVDATGAVCSLTYCRSIDLSDLNKNARGDIDTLQSQVNTLRAAKKKKAKAEALQKQRFYPRPRHLLS